MAEILARASTDSPAGGDGIPLSSLLASAREMGMDVERVRTAALSQDSVQHRGSPTWGGKRTIRIERALRGELTEADLAPITEEIRDATGLIGKAKTVGDGFEWLAGDPPIIFTVSRHSGAVRAKCVSHCAGVGGVIYFLVMLLTLFAGLVTTLVLAKQGTASSWVLPLAALIGYLVSRTAYSKISANRERQCRAAMDRVASYLDAREEVSSPLANAAPIVDEQPQQLELGQS